jgi:hypothetical protein
MISYQELSKARKRWVDLVELHYPEIDKTISLQQIKDIHDFFTTKRTEDKKYKVSKALWVVTNNKVSRGVYRFPGSKSEFEETETPIIDDELETLYKAELIKLGIQPKK